MRLDLSPSELRALLADPFVDDPTSLPDGARLLIVHDDGSDLASLPTPGALPVVVALTAGGHAGHAHRADSATDRLDAVDLVVTPRDIERLEDVVRRAPIASASLAILLRAHSTSTRGRDVETGLAAESAVYSTLQSGPEFRSWRDSTTARALDVDADPARPVVRVERADERLLVTLDRPARHNAITARLRDELHAALAPALVDDSITLIELRGSGPSFCSGGDLDEFGRRPDPATAHITRLLRSPARSIHRLRDRIAVHVHGATFGGGIEIAAFAARVVARRDTRIALPEISLGLIPGAGGTVSLPRRIGRHRTAWLALTAREIDASTALDWGLVDEIGAGTATSPS